MKTNNLKGYKIDFPNKSVIVNHKFAKAAALGFTAEADVLAAILKKFPHFEIVEMAGRKNKTCHHDKNLTYAHMETYISTKDNADELMAAYWIARTESAPQKSRYAHVRKWFITQFPNYREVSIVETTASTVTVPFGGEAA